MRVLVVDDGRAVREGLDRVLRRDGFEVLLAGDGESARCALASRRPDAVARRPVAARLGRRALRRVGDRTPVLMLTARDAVADGVAGWRPAPTTTSSSRSRSRSCGHACTRCCGAPVPPTGRGCCAALTSSSTRRPMRRAAVAVRSRSRGPSFICSSCFASPAPGADALGDLRARLGLRLWLGVAVARGAGRGRRGGGRAARLGRDLRGRTARPARSGRPRARGAHRTNQASARETRLRAVRKTATRAGSRQRRRRATDRSAIRSPPTAVRYVSRHRSSFNRLVRISGEPAPSP